MGSGVGAGEASLVGSGVGAGVGLLVGFGVGLEPEPPELQPHDAWEHGARVLTITPSSCTARAPAAAARGTSGAMAGV